MIEIKVAPEFKGLVAIHLAETRSFLVCPVHGPMMETTMGNRGLPTPIARVLPKFQNNARAVNAVNVDIAFLCHLCDAVSVTSILEPRTSTFEYRELELCSRCAGSGKMTSFIGELTKCSKCDGYGLLKKEVVEQVVKE